MLPIPTTRIRSTSLYFREGNSDKEYHAAIEPQADGFVVTFAYGRRGSTLNTGTKTQFPISLKEATKVFDKLVASKLVKGYQYNSASAGQIEPYRQSGDEGTDSGIRCQLLNPIEEADLSALLTDSLHCLQEKHDGRRLMIRKKDHEITGINRRGLVVAIPEPIRSAASRVPGDYFIDGEAVGDKFHAFDMLESNGLDLRQRRYIDRFSGLLMLLPSGQPALRTVSTAIEPTDKVETCAEIRQANGEGVVLKDMNAPFSPGRPNSGGPQLKFKFVETASFIVTDINTKRSVTLGLYDGTRLVPAGNVTIPPNHEVPAPGDVVEVKYLYAFKESGSIYQPVYLGRRTDIEADDCTTDQLKYKAELAGAISD